MIFSKKQPPTKIEMRDAFTQYISNRAKSVENHFQTKNILNTSNMRFFNQQQLTQSELGNLYFNSSWVNRCINILAQYILKNGVNIMFDKEEHKKRQKEFERFFEKEHASIAIRTITDTLIYGGGIILKQDTNQNVKKTYELSSNTDLYYIPSTMYSALPSYIPNTFIINGVSQFIISGRNIKGMELKATSKENGQYSLHKSAIDKSYCINFVGLPVPYEYLGRYKYQGGSIIAPNLDNIKAELIILENICNLVFRNGVVIYKHENLLDKMAGSKENTVNFFKNLELINSGINSTGMAQIDKNEDILSLGLDLSYLDVLSMGALSRLCGYFGLSLTKVLGKSPDGQNSTGQADEKHDKETIEGWQKHFYKPIKEVIECATAKFFGEKDIKFDYEFNSLTVMSPDDKMKYEAGMIKNAQDIADAKDNIDSLQYLYDNDLVTGDEFEERKAKLDDIEKILSEENDNEDDEDGQGE